MSLSRLSALRAAACASLVAWSCIATAVVAGDQAPEFELPGPVDGVQLSALRGKLIYLDFWASWCGPCKQSFPWMNDMQSRFGPQGLQVIAVNVDAREVDARRFLAQTPAGFSVAFDPRGDTPRRYEIKGMPTSVLIGADGKVLHVHSGFRADERASLETQITQALARSPRPTNP